MGEVIEAEFRKPRSGNGAREAVIAWLAGPPVCPAPDSSDGLRDFNEMTADALLAYLWLEGFKIVPLDSDDVN